MVEAAQRTQNPTTPTTPQFTKRKQFMGFKIRSKPISNSPPGPAKPKEKGKKRTGGELYEWVISIVAAAAVAGFLKNYGFSLFLAASMGILTYALVFGIFVVLDTIKSRREMRDQIISGLALQKERNALHEEKPSMLPWRTQPLKNEKEHQPKTKEHAPAKLGESGPKGPLAAYINGMLKSKRTLEGDLRLVGIKKSPYEFIKTMIIYAAVIAAIITIVLLLLLNHFGAPLFLAPVFGLCIYLAMFNKFLQFPTERNRTIGRLVERDILFAARDIVIGMRSGMPLFNSITAVSTGYGETSKEFGRIIELVQLGMPIEQAMEEVSERSESKTFKRLMLQASVSIKAGVDVTSSLQDVVDEVTQERIIDLRRYGQKLNALAMFYMLFGVIFPSMGIAVATIMSTFINIFPVTYVVLILALVFIAFVQIVLLNIMRTSRPVFTM